jgi:DNA-binding NtrC family response regulator
VGEPDAEGLTREVVEFVTRGLGREYPWPGNVRELEQCVRNVLIRGHYRAPEIPLQTGGDELAELLRRGNLSAEELVRRYCTQVYAQTGSYEAAARRLGLDRRTVKAKVDPELLERLRS